MEERNERLIGTVGSQSARMTDDRPLRLRWYRGVLQYARYWSDGERQGHEWVDVPTVEDSQ